MLKLAGIIRKSCRRSGSKAANMRNVRFGGAIVLDRSRGILADIQSGCVYTDDRFIC